jgi:hypothetical protein
MHGYADSPSSFHTHVTRLRHVISLNWFLPKHQLYRQLQFQRQVIISLLTVNHKNCGYSLHTEGIKNVQIDRVLSCTLYAFTTIHSDVFKGRLNDRSPFGLTNNFLAKQYHVF